MLAEIGAPAIWTGWLAAAVHRSCPALASSDAAMRLLRRNWKRVQRLAYPAAVLTLVHWALVHDGLVSALVHFAPLIAPPDIAPGPNLSPTPHRKEDCMILRIPPDCRRARDSPLARVPPPPPAR